MALEENVGFSSAEINIIVHATENENKILQSINDILSISAEKFSGSPSEGHWGNKILLLTATIDSQAAKSLVSKIISSLNSSDRISLSESDSIRIRFRPVKRYRPSNTVQNYRGLLTSSE